VWFPKWHAKPLTLIIDVVFLGDRLYGITKDEDLAFLDIAYDNDGVPMVTGGECVIGKDFDVWSNDEDYDDEEEDGDDDSDNDNNGDDDNDDNYDDDNDDDDEDNNDDDDDDDEDEDEDDDDDDEDEYTYDLTKMTKGDINDTLVRPMNIDESRHEMKPTMIWYLIESRGKLLMLTRQVISQYYPDLDEDLEFTRPSSPTRDIERIDH
jgi:hypothetical protein